MINLFVFKNGTISLNNYELLTIEAFKNIIKRDRGDVNKVTAFKEFGYIWFTCDNRSPLLKQGKAVKDISKKATTLVGLPLDWKPDDIVKEAMEVYKDLNVNVAESAVNSLLDIFGGYPKIITKVKSSLDSLLSTPGAISQTQAEELMRIINLTLLMSRDIPIQIRVLRDAIQDLEMADKGVNAEQLRGSAEVVPSSANLESDY
jgi:hypothetical protein